MSQHVYLTQHSGRPVKVLMGWDRPLQGFFMVVERMDPRAPNMNDPDDDGEESYLYCNLDHEDSHPITLTPFLTVLSNFGIKVPDAMIKDLRRDGVENMGNKHVDWTTLT